MRRIRDKVTPYGICKIVPPPEWQPTCQVSLSNPKRFPTRKQQIDTLQQGQAFDDGKKYTIAEYKVMADAFYQAWCDQHHGGKAVDQEALARDYWNIVETNKLSVAVEYGNDLDTSKYDSGFVRSPQSISGTLCGASGGAVPTVGTVKSESPSAVKQEGQEESKTSGAAASVFDEAFYASSGWNLNNIPTTKGSLLQYLRTPVNGVNVPWLYVGMLFASFCWHNEDNYCYSISYNHFGATKQWYGVPGDSAAHFEKVRTIRNIRSFAVSSLTTSRTHPTR